MTIRHELHLAYVLHSRPYRETSLLLEMLSLEQGRITLVARGAKRGKLKTSNILQLFAPLAVSWYGNGDLVTLTNIEPAGVAHSLQAARAICGMYINELLVKLIHKWDPCAQLFSAYQQVLNNLALLDVPAQISLRRFEKQLLTAMGYGLQLTKEITTGATVKPELYYLFDPVLGPRLVNSSCVGAIKGQSLIALQQDAYEVPEVLLDIKQLMLLVFNYHLGARPVMARQLL